MNKPAKQVTITKETLIPISLISIFVLGAVRVERIGWLTDQVTVKAAENTTEIKAQGKEIDEVKVKILETLGKINERLAVLEGVRNGRKD